MRLKSLLVAVFGLISLGLVSAEPAAAFHWDRPDQPAGWDRMRTIRHWVYRPHYNHVYLTHFETDPYAYRYVPRGYYPYYNSMYWRPAGSIHRAKSRLPPYYQSWGAPKRGYHHVEWHRRHYGGHRRGNW